MTRENVSGILSDYQQMCMCWFPKLAVRTYNIKEALTGIYGVQQLIHMVLNEEQRGVKKKDRPILKISNQNGLNFDTLSNS